MKNARENGSLLAVLSNILLAELRPCGNPEGDHGKHHLMTALSSQERDTHVLVEEGAEEMNPSFFRRMPHVASTGIGGGEIDIVANGSSYQSERL